MRYRARVRGNASWRETAKTERKIPPFGAMVNGKMVKACGT
jgi:hypothetical protein